MAVRAMRAWRRPRRAAAQAAMISLLSGFAICEGLTRNWAQESRINR